MLKAKVFVKPLAVGLNRSFAMTSFCRMKKINETVKGNVVEVSASFIESDRKGKVLDNRNPHEACTLCRLNIKPKFSDVLILEQFMRPDGTVLPNEVTGLCSKQQENIENLVLQAHWSGLFPSHKPADYNASFEAGEFRKHKRYWNDADEVNERKLQTLDGIWYYVKRY